MTSTTRRGRGAEDGDWAGKESQSRRGRANREMRASTVSTSPKRRYRIRSPTLFRRSSTDSGSGVPNRVAPDRIRCHDRPVTTYREDCTVTSEKGDNTLFSVNVAIAVRSLAAAGQSARLHTVRGAREERFRCRADRAPIRAALCADFHDATDRIPESNSAGATRTGNSSSRRNTRSGQGPAATRSGNTVAAPDRARAKRDRRRAEGGRLRSGVDDQG
jgi:hypothetical protein